MFRFAEHASVVSLALGHVAMNMPPSWADPDGLFGTSDNWRKAGCVPGTGRNGGDDQESDAKHCAVHWYSNWTFRQGPVTLPDHMRTYKFPKRLLNNTPWFAPGTAPVFSPCGIDGGNPHGCPAGNPDPFACAGGGRGHGDDARTLPGNSKPAEWIIGKEVEVAYGIEANHGGGYTYRLCPKPVNMMDLTEECFMKMPLTLGNKSFVQWHGDEKQRHEFTPLRTTSGTTPAGSQWSRQAVPACKGLYPGEGGVLDFLCLRGPIFKPPVPRDLHHPQGTYGFWGGYSLGHKWLGMGRVHTVSVVDTLTVPEVPVGEYVLQFRYDAEQTPQVWNSCSDVKISAPEITV